MITLKDKIDYEGLDPALNGRVLIGIEAYDLGSPSRSSSVSVTIQVEVSLIFERPGRVAQWVTCLARDASLTADPWVASSITAWSKTFVEIDYEIISTVILLPSAESFKDCCHLQATVCARSTG